MYVCERGMHVRVKKLCIWEENVCIWEGNVCQSKEVMYVRGKCMYVRGECMYVRTKKLCMWEQKKSILWKQNVWERARMNVLNGPSYISPGHVCKQSLLHLEPLLLFQTLWHLMHVWILSSVSSLAIISPLLSLSLFFSSHLFSSHMLLSACSEHYVLLFQGRELTGFSLSLLSLLIYTIVWNPKGLHTHCLRQGVKHFASNILLI